MKPTTTPGTTPGSEPQAGTGAPATPRSPGTIVVATHNRSGRVVENVGRLLRLPDGWPVVVVDDASDDDTTEALHRAYGDRIRVLTLDRNHGAAARNRGVDIADTDVVAFADDDSWWADGALTAAAEVLRDDPDVGLVVAQVIVEPDGRPDPIVTDLVHSPLTPTSSGPSVLGFLACGAVVRRRAFQSAGGFEPLLHIGGEEQLLAIDMRATGWQLAYVDRVRAHHAPAHADTGRRDRTAHQRRNEILVAVMRRPWPVVGRAVATMIRRAPTDPVTWRALAGVVRRLPAAVAVRRPVPPRLEAELTLLGNGA